ncbi:MAG: RNA methyltransferase [Clostridia bacterium]|nr:RNA methyltransferase [Clostridia bacterium]
MITSKQNQLIKKIRSLGNKKFRDIEGLYVVEGIKMVNEAVKLGQKIEYIVCTESARLMLSVENNEIITVTDEIFDYLSTEVTPQGALAVICKPNVKLSSPTDSCLLLDGVSDPANVGAIIRTAVASGYKDLYLVNCADAYSPKAVRTSMSGIYGVNVYTLTHDDVFKVINLPLVVADMGGENVFELSINEKFCLVIGNEAHGVSEIVRKRAQKVISIPMEKGMESLNASVSAGILMYALKNKF